MKCTRTDTTLSNAGRPVVNMKRWAMALFVFAGSLLTGSAVLTACHWLFWVQR